MQNMVNLEVHIQCLSKCTHVCVHVSGTLYCTICTCTNVYCISAYDFIYIRGLGIRNVEIMTAEMAIMKFDLHLPLNYFLVT